MHAAAPCDSIFKNHEAGFQRGGRAVTAAAITGTDSGPSAAHHSFVYLSIRALLNMRPSPGMQPLPLTAVSSPPSRRKHRQRGAATSSRVITSGGERVDVFPRRSPD